MKKYLIASSFFVLFLFTGCASKNAVSTVAPINYQPSEQKAVVDENMSVTNTPDVKEVDAKNNQDIISETPGNQDNIQPTVLKSYTNNKINISLKYPKDAILSEPVPDVVIFNLTNKKEYLQIQVLETTPPAPEDKYTPNGASFIEDTTIDSKIAKKYFTNNPLGEGVLENGYPFTNYVIKINDKKWIQIGYYGTGESKDIFENIIKSIQFN